MVKFGPGTGLGAAGSRPTPVANWLTAVALLAGVALRLWNYAGGRSLWHDETLIALGLLHLPLQALFGELPFDQMAPVGWLLAERAIHSAWPDIDFGLRLLSLVGGIGALFAHWRLCRLTLSGAETVLSVGLFACASSLIRYSAMVKPYIWDALFAAAILALGVRLLSGRAGRYGTTGLLGVTGLACIFFSFGALTVLASTGIVLFACALVSRDRRWIVSLALIGLIWAGSLGTLYLLDYGRQATLASMVGVYWVNSFAPAPTSLHALTWYYRAPAGVLSFLLTGLPPLVLVLGVAIGAIAACLRRPWVGALLIGPLVAALLASAIRAYPLDSRLQMALASPAILLLTHAAGTVAKFSPRPDWIFAALSIPLFGFPAAASAHQALRKPPWALEEVEPNLVRLHREARGSDLLLVTPFAERALLLYAPKLGLRPRAYLVTEHRAGSQCWVRGLERLPARGTLWLLTYHERGTLPATAAVLASLRLRGDLKVADAKPGSTLYRVDLARQLPESPIPPACYAPRNFSKDLDALAREQGFRPLPIAAPR